jgi:hypothetical protein
MQDAIKIGFFVIPAREGLPRQALSRGRNPELFVFLVPETWTPAFSRVTNRFASSRS